MKVVFTAGTWEVQDGTETLLRTARKVDAIEFAHRTATASGTGVTLYKKNGEVQLSVAVCRGHNPGWKPRAPRSPAKRKRKRQYMIAAVVVVALIDTAHAQAHDALADEN